MSTLVFHSSSLGVTEYDATFTGLAGDYEALDDGVYRVDGALDVATPFVSSFAVAPVSKVGGVKRVPRYAYLQADTDATFHCAVKDSAGTSYSYRASIESGRVQRVVFGRGIRDNYLGFTFTNPQGEAFRLDHLEIVTDKSVQRKV